MTRMQARMLPDGRRLHLNDGPIDLIVSAEGDAADVGLAYAAVHARFATVLDELCAELPLLRQAAGAAPSGLVALRMWQATLPLGRHAFITPMAAVAGSVAEEMLAAMCAAAPLSRAFVHNGGDIALHVAPGESLAIGLQPDSALGSRPVTRQVGALRGNEIAAALAAGVAFGETLLREGRIIAAALHLAGQTRTLGRIDAGSEGQEVPRLGRGDPS